MSQPSLRDRFFQMVFRLTRSLTMGVRGVVINQAGEVLLIRHTYTPGWHFPGGGVEKGETAELALSRELIEEAGIRMTGQPELFGIYSNHQNFPNDHVLLYLIRDWEQAEATSHGEIAELGFFPLDALPDGITQGTKQRLMEVFGTDPVIDVWSPNS